MKIAVGAIFSRSTTQATASSEEKPKVEKVVCKAVWPSMRTSADVFKPNYDYDQYKRTRYNPASYDRYICDDHGITCDCPNTGRTAGFIQSPQIAECK